MSAAILAPPPTGRHAELRSRARRLPARSLEPAPAPSWRLPWPSPCLPPFLAGAWLPEWHEASGQYVDPDTGEFLPTWDQALDAVGPHDQPLHVARYRTKFDAQGVGLLRRHVVLHLANVPLGKIDTPMIRDWRTRLLHQGVSVSETAKAYRFLRAVLMTAADDRVIPRNPCRVRGAGEEKPEERPVLTLLQVQELADRMPRDCYRGLGPSRRVG